MDRLQQQQSSDAPLPPRRPDGSLGPQLSRPSGGSRGFAISLEEQWQLPSLAEAVRREDPVSAGLPLHGQTLTAQDYGKCNMANPKPVSWDQPLKAVSYDPLHRVSTVSCTSGSSWGSPCGSLGMPSSSVSQFSTASPARSVDVLFCPQRIPIPSWACCGGRRGTVGSSTASLSMGSGSSVRSPSTLNHLSHDIDVAPAGVLSYGVSEEGLPSLSTTLLGSSTLTYADAHLRGGSVVPDRPASIGTFQRRATSPPTPIVQAPASETGSSGSYGPRTGTSSTATSTGVPVTRHFDPQRASPFELSKFDRRDPYVHFYIPVDCPSSRQCCDGICPLAHTKLEKIFHPIVYKTQKCQMALADTGRCPYINKCAFFHTEEDRQQAELHWEAWEAEWAPWRQQIDQLLRRHHKLEKEILRKVEGIIKIRMPRSSPSDLLGRCLANLGVLTGFGEQKKPTIPKSSQGVGPIESGVGSVSFSLPRGRGFAESTFAGKCIAGLADSGRTLSGPRLAESVGFCGMAESPLFGLQPTSAVIGNTRRVLGHCEDHAFSAGREWLYIENSWKSEVAQQHNPGGGFQSRVERASISTRSTLQETLAPVGKDGKAFHSPGTLVPIPEIASKHDAKVSIPSEHGFSHSISGQRAADSVSLHGSPLKSCGCGTLRSSSKDHESLPLRAGEASIRAVTAAEVETGNRVVSTVVTSETQQTVAISGAVDTTVASRMSRRETMSHEETSSYPKPLNAFVCKPLHFARSPQASAASNKQAVVETLPSAQTAVERGCADTVKITDGHRMAIHASRLIIPASSSRKEIRSCEDERRATVTSGGSSCCSSIGFPRRASSDFHYLLPCHQQAVSVEVMEDRQKVVWTRGTTEALSVKERTQAGEVQRGSAPPSHREPSTSTYSRSVVCLQGAQTGGVASQRGLLGSQEPLRVADDEPVLQVARASQAMPVQRGISSLDASTFRLLKNDCVAQVEPLGSVTSQRSSMPPVSSTPALRSSACEERPGVDYTDGTKSSAGPAKVDAQGETERKYSSPTLLPLPNENAATSEGEAVDNPQKPVAAGAAQGALEEPKLEQLWNRAVSEEGIAVSHPLPDISEGEAFSVAIDTVMHQTKIPFREGYVTVSKDEFDLLARRLTHILRAAADEIRRLDIGAVGELVNNDEHPQNRGRVGVEHTPTTSGSMAGSASSGSGSNQAVEALPGPNAASSGAERQRCAATASRSETRDRPPD
ncbi:hypothetical protein, conserved [Eimeria brunetti]|uniref:C3H1-type domain-containing protein n=1 Tax=Eimeria brunetti TaxID=51314 RepID=U6LPK7_9EIME|nr:hypothetical protein, conserved [Eimeria brunetti]